MGRHPLCFASLLALLSGCATLMHGPYQDVRIESDPPGAKATISPMISARGPAYLDDKKQTVTTPATVRLRRDNTYRVEVEKSGYKIGNSQVLSSYDWLWSPLPCGPCEAVGELPSADVKESSAPVQFANALYEYPKGGIKAFGYTLRLFSPEALMGNSFKLKPADGGFFSDWHGLGEPSVAAKLEPLE
jgi:hypothetical protein